MIQPPKWCKDAVPTLRGWEHPTTKELFISKRFSQEEIDVFYGVQLTKEEMFVESTMQLLTEAPANNKSLEDMTKVELQALAEQSGVLVSKSATKKTLIEKLS